MSTSENESPNDDLVESAEAAQPSEEESQSAQEGTITLDDELQRLRSENAELKDRALRTQAELENFRRRTQKDALEAMKYQALPVIRDFLPGIDNLQRAIAAAEQTGDTPNLIDGIKMVAQQLADALKSHSCEIVDPVGQPFDPNLHEALSQVPSAEHEPMTVLQVVEAGYKIHDRMIRPAKVLVTCAPPEDA